MMDTIDVQKLRYQHENGQSGDEYIVLVLNGEQVKGTFDVWQFCLASNFKRKTWEILTCSCGHAGCAGIWDGTDVKQRRYNVEWRDVDSGLPKRFYSFNRYAYQAVAKKAFQLMLEIVERREADGIDDTNMYGVLSSCTLKDFWRSWERSKKWYAMYDN